ncbi:hypothetical protein N7492_009826 [Penicillium capsulatum]|uniref:Uncharacterized protein n=1 Tax=Penicillium capsulatum TaxID=69766 RepID=A0A9W9HN45_9EURO|nr:hypothetical protein N7492_009826 [Penicillium capsulatum]
MNENSSKKGPTRNWLGPKNAKEQEMIHRHLKGDLVKQESDVPKPEVKLYETLSSPEEHESKDRTTKTPVTEGQPCHGEGTRSFNTLEKGLIYFFYRSKVDILQARGINDVAKSFIVLRPTPSETDAGQRSTMELGAKFRLLVVPKKVFPTLGPMKEMAFVEKAGMSLEELQKIFISGGEYETQTYGTRTTPRATLFAKGVYTITSVQRNSYLSYILTNPTALGPVQADFGLHVQGSWLVQSKNPKLSSPPAFSLPKSPEYPESIGDIFGFHRWVPLQPELIEYSNAQILLIGRSHNETFSVVLKGKRGDVMGADEELEDLARRNAAREDNFRGNESSRPVLIQFMVT